MRICERANIFKFIQHILTSKQSKDKTFFLDDATRYKIKRKGLTGFRKRAGSRSGM